MPDYAFINREYAFVQVNMTLGTNSKNFGIKLGESEVVKTDESVFYCWLAENDAILESEFRKFGRSVDATTIEFGHPPGEVLR